MPIIAPFGSWQSPVTPALLATDVVNLSFPLSDGQSLYWMEARPTGSQVIVRRRPDGSGADVTPDGFSARTLVHEYGGRCYAVQAGSVWFSNFADQRMYRVDGDGLPSPITAEAAGPSSHRYADQIITADGRWVVCVRERHLDVGVVNDLVVVPSDGSSAPRPVAMGHDFFAGARLAPDGRRLAWLTWDHPRMPWDGTELWEATVDAGFTLGTARRVAGGPSESISQPCYSPGGVLHFISDRTGWWNVYADDGRGGHPVWVRDAEFGGPDWLFGQSSFAFTHDGSLVLSWWEDGAAHLGVLRPNARDVSTIPSGHTSFSSLASFGAGVVAVAASPTEAPAVVEIAIPSGRTSVIKRSRRRALDAGYVSLPRALEYPTTGGDTAHALYYPPVNADHAGPPRERPPLVVMSHGGPTASASPVLNYSIQFWTSRGLAVVDVDYRGSTGYGRAYRRRINGAWGVVDVDDCVSAARWLADSGEVDGRRMVIRGASAGGYTTLCALTFRDVFAAGASYFGVADVAALARDTHKFEAHYLDGLIGPWPEAQVLYERRSPIAHVDRLATPVILFQGLDDKVVPPDQAEMMAAALRANGVPFCYIAYPREQHGFRKAETIKHAAQAELSFYGRVLGFDPPGVPSPIQIENDDHLPARKP